PVVSRNEDGTCALLSAAPPFNLPRLVGHAAVDVLPWLASEALGLDGGGAPSPLSHAITSCHLSPGPTLSPDDAQEGLVLALRLSGDSDSDIAHVLRAMATPESDIARLLGDKKPRFFLSSSAWSDCRVG